MGKVLLSPHFLFFFFGFFKLGDFFAAETAEVAHLHDPGFAVVKGGEAVEGKAILGGLRCALGEPPIHVPRGIPGVSDPPLWHRGARGGLAWTACRSPEAGHSPFQENH